MESIKLWTSMKNLFASIYSSWISIVVFFLLLVGGVFISARSIDTSSLQRRTSNFFAHFTNQPQQLSYTINCPQNITRTPICNSQFTLPPSTTKAPPPPTCPSYFRYIHEDLRPWNSTGITKQAVENAKKHAAFRLVVINGKPYLDKYHGVFQTRDVFTLWGILQLLNKYPGKVKDFDMMFNCGDMPVVRPSDYANDGTNTTTNGTDLVHNPLPPLFRYCKDDTTVDIVFPDWSFWGWPEVNIKPWVIMKKELEKGNKKIEWKKRDLHAYWKGNPWVSNSRQDLMQCNLSKDNDWNARLYTQDWGAEIRRGFKSSDLSSQCTHRYKIYIEGRAWSVSEKYILACDSPTLFVQTRFRDFFTRGMIPGKHYLPIPDNDKCRAIKDTVDWGNSHPDKAREIGRTGSGFVQEELKMDYVYDYMLHLLNEYSKLLRYKLTVPKNAVELCLESMVCKARGKVKSYMIESMVESPSDAEPCIMPS